MPERISSLDQCTPNMFIAVVEAMLHLEVPGLNRDPVTEDDDRRNTRALLFFLGEASSGR